MTQAEFYRTFDARALNALPRAFADLPGYVEQDVTSAAVSWSGGAPAASSLSPVIIGSPGLFVAFRALWTDLDEFEPHDALRAGFGAYVQTYQTAGDAASVGLAPDLASLRDARGKYYLAPSDVLKVPYLRARVDVRCSAIGAGLIAAGSVRLVLAYGFAAECCGLPRQDVPILTQEAYFDAGADISQGVVSVDDASTQVIAASSTRRDLTIQNHGSTPVDIHIGTGSAVYDAEGIRLDAGMSIPFRAWGLRVTSRVAAIRDTGATAENVGYVATA